MSHLKNSPVPNEKKMKDILDAWIESSDPSVPITPKSLSDILKSSDVGLHDVAKDFVEVCRLHTVHSGLGHRCTRQPRCGKCGHPSSHTPAPTLHGIGN